MNNFFSTECRWSRQKSRFWAYIWLHHVLSTLPLARCYQHGAAEPWQVVTRRRSLLMVGDDDEISMTRSFNVTPKTTEQHLNACTGYQSANASNSSCAHIIKSASAAQRRPTWPTCVSLCLRCAVALICVLPFTVTLSYQGLAWPAMGLVVSPSRFQRPGTVWRPIFATSLYPLPVSSTNSRLNCSSGHITWDHSTFMMVYNKRGRKLTLTHCIVLYMSRPNNTLQRYQVALLSLKGRTYFSKFVFYHFIIHVYCSFCPRCVLSSF